MDLLEKVREAARRVKAHFTFNPENFVTKDGLDETVNGAVEVKANEILDVFLEEFDETE